MVTIQRLCVFTNGSGKPKIHEFKSSLEMDIDSDCANAHLNV